MNLAQIALNRGGFILPLIIPAEHNSGLGLMNPSILIHNEKVLINLRAVNYTFYHSERKLFQHPYGPLTYLHPENDIHLRTWNYYLELDDDYNISRINKIDTSKFPDQELWDFVGLEDARLINWEDKLYLTGVRRDTTPNGVGRMELCEIKVYNDRVVEVSRDRIEHPNDPNSYCEKNWMPFLDLPYHYIRWGNPTEVVKIDSVRGTSKTIFTGQFKNLSGSLRGGSQVLSWRDYYVAITHEVDLFRSETDRKDAIYKHRVCFWDKNFNLVKASNDFSIMGGHVEFCVGLAQQGTDFLMTFGFQDNAAYLLKFPEQIFEDIINE